MADNETDGRLILAPHPGPWPPLEASGGGPPFFYLSWPGWEIYLERRLNLPPSTDFRPLILPGVESPGRDFLALDQLVQKAGDLGAGFLSLSRRTPESLPALSRAVRSYPEASPPAPAGPVLDDRSYLALWAVTEWQRRAGEELLNRAAASQRAMWAALKGEAETDLPARTAPAPEEPDRRGAYAWQCWRRLAAPLMRPGDRLAPTAPAGQ
ncbi:MAG: hypothetical protein LBP33_12030 [Candidatus Adiutrix sp.]|jgi:hypothetical protein|nr:hypothetical protein [Candidatus Adiutrix sp.]